MLGYSPSSVDHSSSRFVVRIAGLTIVVALVTAPLPAGAQAEPRETAKSYVIPALEIIGFDALLNIFDRAVLGDDYRSSFSSIRRNLRRRWVTENDPFEINQFGHPYQGAMYHGFARSAGLGFWTSLGYTFAGSAMWEIAGEVTPPSWNDQIASGIAGSFLGEALFRIGNLVLETGPTPTRPGRRFVTTATSTPLSINRRIFGRRFDQIYPSHDAAYYRRFYIGASGTTQTEGGTDIDLRPTEGVFDMLMEYGLPGAQGYTYRRPFDYFSMQVTATTGTGLESILLRGLMVGRGYQLGSVFNGAWGLYGNYDYIAPQLFRVSGTAGHDNIFRLDASFAVRFHQQQALAVRYLLSRRDAFFPGTGSRQQLRGTLGVFYTLLGHDRFGSVHRD